MYCSQCGEQQDGSRTVCPNCQAALYNPGAGTTGTPPLQAESIPNYLVQSILATMCCCVVPGIVAIVYAAQVNALIKAGDFAGARRCSRLARNWSWTGLLLGSAVVGLYIVLAMIGMLAE